MVYPRSIRAKKSLGQNFLIDEKVRDRIISAARLTKKDTVIEVGPGLGALSNKLAENAGALIAVELDKELVNKLNITLARYGNKQIIHGDILKLKPAELLNTAGVSKYKVVANLPYYITSAVIRHFLEEQTKPEILVLMIQKEVAESIIAKPGKMSILSVSVQVYGAAEIITVVPPEAFVPAPSVDSAVVRIAVHDQPLFAKDKEGIFFKVVKAGFSMPRKQLANTLSKGLNTSKEVILKVLNSLEIKATQRAETLSVEQWVKLQVALENEGIVNA